MLVAASGRRYLDHTVHVWDLGTGEEFYPGVGHNSWDNAYATKELYNWLLMQKK